MAHHSQTGVNGQGLVTHQEEIKETFHQSSIANVVGKPRQDPRKAKEGLHVGVQQMVVKRTVNLAEEGKEDQFDARLKPQKIRPQGVLEMRKRNLAEYLGG